MGTGAAAAEAGDTEQQETIRVTGGGVFNILLGDLQESIELFLWCVTNCPESVLGRDNCSLPLSHSHAHWSQRRGSSGMLISCVC